MCNNFSTSENKIDLETVPACKFEEHFFDWGEPYTVMTPLFDIEISDSLSDIEFAVEFYGRNNFQTQLHRLRNKLINYDEEYSIENFSEKIEDRRAIIQIIEHQLKNNENKITPWDKYNEYMDELKYIEWGRISLNRKLLYVKME